MIILREKLQNGYIYKDSKNKIIKDPKILAYIKSLPAIPPAYENVKIFYEKSPKILFEGIDSKGRKQQIYSPKWRQKADLNKFKSLIEFGKKMPNINKKILELLEKPFTDSDKNLKEIMIAIILRMITLCGFRIGQLKYQLLYNSIGLSTIKKKHIKHNKNYIEIEFIGKKNMINDCIITDAIIISHLKTLTKNKKNDDFIFTYNIINPLTNKKETKLINAIDVNNWLKKFNANFTTKFFRTFDVNDKLIDILKQTDPSKMTERERKKKIIETIKIVSNMINNTPAICKKSYINNELIKFYIEHPRKYQSQINANNHPSRINFINFLEKNIK